MRRLHRKSLYTQDNSLEVRVEQLERRIFTQPTHWAAVSFAITPQSVSSGGTLLTWERFRTTNTQVFSTSALGGAANNAAGDEAIRLASSGIVVVSGWVQWDSGVYYRRIAVNGGGGETDPISNLLDVTDRTSWNPDSVDDDANLVSTSDTQWFQSGEDSSASWFVIQANVGAGDPNQDAITGSLTVVLFPPSGVLWDNTVVY